jgi:hypothetical protein
MGHARVECPEWAPSAYTTLLQQQKCNTSAEAICGKPWRSRINLIIGGGAPMQLFNKMPSLYI